MSVEDGNICSRSSNCQRGKRFDDVFLQRRYEYSDESSTRSHASSHFLSRLRRQTHEGLPSAAPCKYMVFGQDRRHIATSSAPPPCGNKQRFLSIVPTDDVHPFTKDSKPGMTMAQPGYMGSPPVVGEFPVACTCPQCRAHITARTAKSKGLLIWLNCGGLCFFGCCCCIPFCADACKVSRSSSAREQHSCLGFL